MRQESFNGENNLEKIINYFFDNKNKNIGIILNTQ